MSQPLRASSAVKSAPSDLPAQLLEAVHRRDADASRRLANQWAHRRGVASLVDFVTTTLGQAQPADAVAWLEQLIDCPLAHQPQLAAPVLEFAPELQAVLPIVAEQPEELPPLSVPVPLFSENPVPEALFEVEHEGAVLVTISEPHQGWPPASALPASVSLEAVVESTLDEAMVAYSLIENPASGLSATETADSSPIVSPSAGPSGPSGSPAGLAGLSAEPPLLSPDPSVFSSVSVALRSQGLSRVGLHLEPEVPLQAEVPLASEVPLESRSSTDRGPLTRLRLRLRHALDTAMAPFQASEEPESFEPATAPIGEAPIGEELPLAPAPSSPFAEAIAPVAGEFEFAFPIPGWTAELPPDQTPDPNHRLKMPSLPRSNRPAPAPEALADLRIWLPDAAEDLPRAS